MFDEVVMLDYSRYFPCCPQPRWTAVQEAKIAWDNLVVRRIRIISARNISVCVVFVKPISKRDAFGENTYIYGELFDIGSWLWIKWNFIDMFLNFVEPCDCSIITDFPCTLQKFWGGFHFTDWQSFSASYIKISNQIGKLCINDVNNSLQILRALLTCWDAMHCQILFIAFS